MVSLVLASASPRRRQLLEQLGVSLELAPADVDETPTPGEGADTFARRMARAKAAAAAARLPGRWVLAADTVVAVDRDLLGKPSGRRSARAMLEQLSGRAHRVYTAVVLQAPDGHPHLDDVATTVVRFRPLTARDIDAYLDSGEAWDKAGAYAIQGRAGAFVAAVDGSYSNVVGLPMELVAPALRRAGFAPSRPTGAACS